MVLLTYFKAFKVVSRQKKFCINFSFFVFFFHIRHHGFFEKMTKFFYESYWPEIHRKLHKWCCKRILKLFRLFRAKKKFCMNFSFFEFFCISGVMDFLKNH